MKKVALGVIAMALLILPFRVIAGENPGQEGCRLMATRTEANLNHMKSHTPFWSHTETREVYILALHAGFNGVAKFAQHHSLDTQARAAIVMAAIAKHDITMLRYYYEPSVNKYAIKTVKSGPLTWSAMCNFEKGVLFLLKSGINPNEYSGVNTGPFNFALFYKNSDIPDILLKSGYQVDHNYKECQSSKYILRRHRGLISTQVSEVIDQTVCRKPE